MKHILASVVLLVFLFPSLALGETMDDLVVREGLYYKKFSDVPFTGKTTGLSQGTFRNGKWDGPLISYWDTGQLQTKGTYKNGKKHGPWVHYHDNGRLSSKRTYKDDKRDGPWVQYWGTGQLMHKGTYKDGEIHGPWVGYKQDGTVWDEYTGTFKNGVKVK